jgi:hypothetical protein
MRLCYACGNQLSVGVGRRGASVSSYTRVSPPGSDAPKLDKRRDAIPAIIVVRVPAVRLGTGISACVAASCAMCLGLFQGVSLAQSGARARTGVLLSVAPLPTAANPAPGTPRVTWSTGDGSPGEVTVSSEGPKEVLFASASDGSAAAPWIAVGRSYVFRLYSTVSGRRLLARLKIGRAAALEVVALPQSPRSTSPVVDRLLQLLSFGALILLGLLSAIYVRDVRRG